MAFMNNGTGIGLGALMLLSTTCTNGLLYGQQSKEATTYHDDIPGRAITFDIPGQILAPQSFHWHHSRFTPRMNNYGKNSKNNQSYDDCAG